MKLRESGMPNEAMWSGFFDPAQTLAMLGLSRACRDVVDLGCGYGTFAIPAARIVAGTVFAFDIDPAMTDRTQELAVAAGLTNVQARTRDFMVDGTGLPSGSVDYVMAFNLLHGETPEVLLREAARVLSPRGTIAIMHWRYDPTTPRGPSLEIRPRPEQCLAWAGQAGFHTDGAKVIDLPPYHYGLVLSKSRERP